MRAANRIGRIDTAGNVTTFAIPTAATDPTGIAAGWDGALWFTEPDTDAIGRITTGGSITEFALPNVGSSPFGITGGPDDAVWFTEGNGNRIGRLGAVDAPIDTTAPTISITSPVEGSVFVQEQQIAAGYGCADEAGGSGLSTCAGPVIDGQAIDTSIGSHRFEVKASDVQGNTATASTGYIVFSDLGGSLAHAHDSARRVLGDAGSRARAHPPGRRLAVRRARLPTIPAGELRGSVAGARRAGTRGREAPAEAGRTGRPVANRPCVDRLMPRVRAAVHPCRVERHRRRLLRPIRHRAVETLTTGLHD